MSIVDGTSMFAPRIPWSEVSMDVETLPDQLRQRFEGFYLQPAEALLQQALPADFAAGVLILCTFDAIARLWTGRVSSVRGRFVEASGDLLAGFEGYENELYDFYRNGLVHEGRIKQEAQFDSNAEDCIVMRADGSCVVNPRSLLVAVKSALDQLLSEQERFKAKALPLLAGDFKAK